MKLSKAQKEVVDYIKSGGTVHFIKGIESYFFRGDNYKKVTKACVALILKGIARIDGYDKLRILP